MLHEVEVTGREIHEGDAVTLRYAWEVDGQTVAASGAELPVGAVMPGLALGLALFGGVSWRYLVEDRAKRQVRALFGRYVSNDVIEQLMDDPALVSLGGQRREMTVLFSDIRQCCFV